jgi:RNA-binding protein
MKREIQSMNIGKNGISKELISEIKSRIKKHKTLRIKILKSALLKKTKKEIAEEVSNKVKAKIADLRGNTFVLKKR